jgi:hypothetical protein
MRKPKSRKHDYKNKQCAKSVEVIDLSNQEKKSKQKNQPQQINRTLLRKGQCRPFDPTASSVQFDTSQASPKYRDLEELSLPLSHGLQMTT